MASIESRTKDMSSVERVPDSSGPVWKGFTVYGIHVVHAYTHELLHCNTCIWCGVYIHKLLQYMHGV
jgi:hypothetical protein